MPGADALLTIAEMAIGLAGFSAVVGAFMQHGALSRSDRYRFFWLFTTAFVAAVLSFVPVIIVEAGYSGMHVWRTASGIMIGIWFIQMGAWFVGLRRTRDDPEMGPPGFSQGSLMVVPSIFNLGLQAANASGFFWEPSAAAYIVGALIWLYAASLVFVAIVIERPAV
jgi:hypothetical protein